MNFKDDLLDGPYARIYTDGSREDFIFQRNKLIGTCTTTFRDGSKMELSQEDSGQKSGIFFTASGQQLKGSYQPPRLDSARRPAVIVPEGMIGKDRLATVRIVVMVAEDGSVHDPQLAQASGYPLLDQAIVKQIAIWHFFPATLDGKPISSMALYEGNFKPS